MFFKDYEERPGMLAVNCDQEIVKMITGNLSGGGGPNSVDGRTLKDWLLYQGEVSQTLYEELTL